MLTNLRGFKHTPLRKPHAVTPGLWLVYLVRVGKSSSML
jgi:hypothetical protein